MSTDRWPQVRELFERLVDLPGEASRQALAEVARTDAVLAAQVARMLQAATEADHAVGTAAPDLLGAMVQQAENARRSRLPGRQIGPWRVLELIGEGGMGEVWLGERTDGQFQRKVAIKWIRGGMAGNVIARFQLERTALARLDHPNIARLIDAGVSEQGDPYLVLEYIDGVPLTRHVRERSLDLRARLALFLDVCDAVDHAHRQLIIHRDIKPSNILITPDGEVKLLDFGIAKLLDPGQESAGLTRTGSLLLTPEYAAPEQLRGDPVGTATDVYQLGVVLYELLTGTRPFADNTGPAAAIERERTRREPLRPSVAVQPDTRRRGPDPDPAQTRGLTRDLRLSRALRGDLDAIVLKALRPEPERRYPGAAELASDLRRHLAQEPVLARRGGFSYRTTRWLSRHRWLFVTLLLVFASMAGALAVSLHQRNLARIEAATSDRLLDFMIGIFESARQSGARPHEVTARSLLEQAAQRVDSDLAEEPAVRARLLLAMARAFNGLSLWELAQPPGEQAVVLLRGQNDAARLAEALLTHAASLHNTRQRARGFELLAEAERIAQDRGDRMLQADVVYLHALGLYGEQQRERSEARLEEVMTLTADQPAAPSRRAAGLMLSRMLASRGEFARAQVLVEQALAQLVDGDPVVQSERAEVLDALGSLQEKMGLHSERLATYREALGIALQQYGAEHFTTGVLHHNLARALFDTGQLRESLVESEAAVAIGTLRVGADHGFTQAARRQRALASCLAGDPEPALAEFDALAALAPREDQAIELQRARERCESRGASAPL
jgi:serine/threonine protein kinase